MENSVFEQFVNSQHLSSSKSPYVPILKSNTEANNSPSEIPQGKFEVRKKEYKTGTTKVLTSSAADIRNFLRADETTKEEVSCFEFSAPKKSTQCKASHNSVGDTQGHSALPKRDKNNRARVRKTTPAKHKIAQTPFSIFAPLNLQTTKEKRETLEEEGQHQQETMNRSQDKRKLSNESESGLSSVNNNNKRNKESGNRTDATNHNTSKEETDGDYSNQHPNKDESEEVYKMDYAGSIPSPQQTNQQDEEHEMADPNSLSLDVVFSMFKKIQVDIDDLKKNSCVDKVQKIEADVAQHTEEIKGINFEQLQQQDKLAKIMVDLDLFKTKTEVMPGIIQRMDVVIKEQANRLDKLDMERARCSIIIKNLYTGPRIIDAKLEVYKLLYEYMQVDVTVNDVYFQAQYSPRPIVVVLLNFEHKKRVFGAIKKIAHLRNKDGKKYFFQDYYTPEVNANRNRYQQIFDMYQDNQAQQEKISATSQELTIGTQKYVKKVQEPAVHEILKLDLSEIRGILASKLYQGKQINEQGSAFLGFTLCVQTHREIRQAYQKLKIVHAGARHIVCAYSIPGQEKHYCNDYCDDGEHGAGKRLLSLLMENGITSRVVFVVRYCHGQKIGVTRHKCFAQAAMNAVNTNKYNHFTKTTQEMTLEEDPGVGSMDKAGNRRKRGKSVFRRREDEDGKKKEAEMNPQKADIINKEKMEILSYLRKFQTPSSTPDAYRSLQTTPASRMQHFSPASSLDTWTDQSKGDWPQPQQSNG